MAVTLEKSGGKVIIRDSNRIRAVVPSSASYTSSDDAFFIQVDDINYKIDIDDLDGANCVPVITSTDIDGILSELVAGFFPDASGSGSTSYTEATMAEWGGVADANYLIGSYDTPSTADIPAFDSTGATNGSQVLIWHNDTANPLPEDANYTIAPSYSYSPNTLNLISGTYIDDVFVWDCIQPVLAPPNDLYNGFVALSPLYAFDFRASAIGDSTVANAGTVGGTAAKSGTFTKDVGLIAGASADVTLSFTQEVFGHSGVANAQDWVYLVKFKNPTTGTNLNIHSLYQNASASSNRLRMRSGEAANDGQLRLQTNDAPSGNNINPVVVGTTQAPNDTRVLMLIKVADEIKVYENGSVSPTNTLTVAALTQLNFDRFTLFTGTQFGGSAVVGLEIEYAGLDFVDAGTFGAGKVQDYINLMTTNP